MFIPSSAQCLCSLKYPSTACFTYLYIPRHHRSSGQTLLQAPRNSSLDDATPRNQERDSFGSSDAPATGFLETTFKTTGLGGGFKYFLFSPLFGEDSHFAEYFFRWVETPTSGGCFSGLYCVFVDIYPGKSRNPC